MRSRRVALITPHLGRDGGVAAHVCESARALGRAGFEVALFGGRVERGFSWDGHHTVDAAFAGAAPPAAALRRAARLIAEWRPDLVHTHDLEAPALSVRLRSVAPVVASVHGYPGCSPGLHYFTPGDDCRRSHGPGCVPNMLLRGCLHSRDVRQIPALYSVTSARVAALRSADATVAYSRRVLAHLNANGARRPSLVPLFVPLPGEAPPDAASRRILFVGRVVAAKGLDVLLRALSLIDAELEVCGDGWYMPRARALAVRLGVAERVAFMGWRSAADLEHSYGRAAMTVMPSLWPEPFGLSGLEALARERPVVASATGGIPEWLDHEQAGLLVAPGDHVALAGAISRLLDDPDRRRAMGAMGRARVEADFSETRHVEALSEVYAGAGG
jgi:glycosyltransferase involved in cell wall biosynthesis